MRLDLQDHIVTTDLAYAAKHNKAAAVAERYGVDADTVRQAIKRHPQILADPVGFAASYKRGASQSAAAIEARRRNMKAGNMALAVQAWERRMESHKTSLLDYDRQLEEARAQAALLDRARALLDATTAVNDGGLELVLSAVANVFGVPVDQIKSHSRAKLTCRAREAFCYVACGLRGFGLKNAAKMIQKDHTTVVYYRDKCAAALDTSPELVDKIGMVEAAIGKALADAGLAQAAATDGR